MDIENGTIINGDCWTVNNHPWTVNNHSRAIECCHWSVHKFIEVNFSKLTDCNQIFRNEFVSIHYHLGEISCQIIECKFFLSIYELYN